MRHRSHLDDETQPVRALQAAAERDEALAPDAALDAAHGAGAPGRGGIPGLARAIDGLQASAGNRAVVSLLQGRTRRQERHAEATTHAGRSVVLGSPSVQRAPGDDDEETPADASTDPNANPNPDPNAIAGGAGSATTSGGNDAIAGTGTSGATDAAGGNTGATPTGTGTATPGASWTRIGPPKNSTYSVSGSLRTVATAIAARTEAGSEKSSPSQDTETATPAGGTEKVTAARVTVAVEVELPSWSDKSSATANQQKEWDRFMTAITTHEDGHVALDRTAYAGVHARMVGQSPADADKKVDDAEAKAKTDNDTYDTNNDHGVKQGTGINPNIDEVTKVPSSGT